MISKMRIAGTYIWFTWNVIVYHWYSGPPDYCFVPCGHMANAKTVKYWSGIPIPCGTSGFQSACPFCATPLLGRYCDNGTSTVFLYLTVALSLSLMYWSGILISRSTSPSVLCQYCDNITYNDSCSPCHLSLSLSLSFSLSIFLSNSPNYIGVKYSLIV